MNEKLHHDLLLKAWHIRCVEEILLGGCAAGEISGTVHTCIGQEMISAVFAQLVSQDDVVFSHHRSHGHFLATVNKPYELLAEILGKKDGVCGGIGGSQHLHAANFYSSGVQGGYAPICSGMAFARKKQHRPGAVVAFMGDGTMGEGAVYESFNFTSLHKLPVLYVVENNLYAQSTSQKETLAGSFEGRAKAFDLHFLRADIWDLEALLSTFSSAIEMARKCAPVLLQIDCYRLSPHSKGDDNRDKYEIESFAERDPLSIFLKSGIPPEFFQLQQEMKDLYQRAKLSSPSELSLREDECLAFSSAGSTTGTITAALNQSLSTLLADDPDAIVIGEDVCGPYGGAFKITKGLGHQFPGQILNFPISESLIVGFAIGCALEGLKPIAEIMFSDFLGLAFDQILNHAAKIPDIYGKPIALPLIIRTPSGGGRGYGGTHGQSLEKYFAGMPGLTVLVLHHRLKQDNLFGEILKMTKTPTLVFENKSLYGLKVPQVGDAWNLGQSGSSTILKSRAPADLTLVAFGGAGWMSELVMQELLKEEIYCDLILPVNVSHPELDLITQSLNQTGKLILVEEGTEGHGLGTEYVSRLHGKLEFTHRHLASRRTVIPAAKGPESEVLITHEKLLQTCLEFFDE